MAVYFLTGSLGSGKTLAAVGRIRDYLLSGRRVATNLDIWTEKLLPRRSRSTLVRLPDKPRLVDLQGLGFGCEERDYTGKRFGLLVLDELGSWFNSRSWNDKERLPVIDWFLHARKYRWDVIFIVQDIEAVDRQLRDALCEHFVRVRRLDRFMVPILGQVLKWFGITLRMPQVHMASVYYGDRADAKMHIERWWYRGRDLWGGYDTGQVFQSGHELLGDQLVDLRCSSSTLSAWHLEGRYERRSEGFLAVLKRWGWSAVPLVLCLPLAVIPGLSVARMMVKLGVAVPRYGGSAGARSAGPSTRRPLSAQTASSHNL